MPSMLPSFNFGDSLYNENKELVRQLSIMYGQIGNVVNTKSSRYVTNVDPPNPSTASGINPTLQIGDFWVNSSSNNAWIMTSRTTDVLVTWTQIT